MTKNEELENEIIVLQCKCNSYDSQIRNAEEVLRKLRQERADVAKILTKKTHESFRAKAVAKKPLGVSDHAIVRYLERKLGLDLNSIRGEILTDDLTTKVKTFGDGKYGACVVKDNVVVTVV